MVQEIINRYNSLKSNMNKGELLPPLMVFSGEEIFFINLFEELLTKSYIDEQDDLNRIQLYGPEITVDTIVAEAQVASMFGGKRIILVREASQVKPSLGKGKNITVEDLPSFVPLFTEGTSVALFYRGKPASAKMRKNIEQNNGTLLIESPLIKKEAEMRQTISLIGARYGLKMAPQAVGLLLDLVGNDLATVDAQLSKLSIAASESGRQVTVDLVADMVGMTKEYNPYELLRAIKEHDLKKVFFLSTHMAENEKRYPLPMIISVLYGFFSTLLVYHFNKKRSSQELIRLLNLKSESHLRDYQVASHFYGGIKTMNILTDLRKADANSKGARGTSMSSEAIFKELIIDILC